MDDPFSTFKLTPGFDLDLDDLRQHFLAASAEHHPDRFTDPLDQADAAERSAQINQAYQTLIDPEARANALLALRGGPAASDDQSLPPTLLMEVMEIREELEQAVADEDRPTIARLRQWATTAYDQHLTKLSKLFAAQDLDGKAVRLELNAMRYVQRMLEQMPDA
ncbi:MAG: Fe-S protein assembly co-chaperone HscB [Planctomycetota bacterium]